MKKYIKKFKIKNKIKKDKKRNQVELKELNDEFKRLLKRDEETK